MPGECVDFRLFNSSPVPALGHSGVLYCRSVVMLAGMGAEPMLSGSPGGGGLVGLLGEQLTREELLARVREQHEHIAILTTTNAALTTKVEDLGARNAKLVADVADLGARNASLEAGNAELVARNEELAAALARAEHRLSRNSANSSMPPSGDDMAGRTPPPKPAPVAARRRRGKQPGAPGAHLRWSVDPDLRVDRFPHGICGCGADLACGVDVGVAFSQQQHDVPRVKVTITQYDMHTVRCGCGQSHTAAPPEGTPDGAGARWVGYGPNVQTMAGFLLVEHHLPVKRVGAVLTALTGGAPSVGFIHGMLARIAARLDTAGVETRIREVIVAAGAVCVDETPIRVGPATPPTGRKKAHKYVSVASTDTATSYVVGDRDLATFARTVIPDLPPDAVMVHDRYQNYDSQALGVHTHQLCVAHLLRDLAGAAEVYPEQSWPIQTADALRKLVHEANQARAAGASSIDPERRDWLIRVFRSGVQIGLHHTHTHTHTHIHGRRSLRPGERKVELLLETLHDRDADVLRFAFNLNVPATSNQAERDLRPAKIQQKISGRLTSLARTQERYRIRGYLSTAAKYGLNAYDALYQVITGTPWMPPDPAPG